MGGDPPMTDTLGFDRRIELAWLDLIASKYAETRDPSEAFDATRAVVELTVGGGASHHNATGKTTTVLARIWLRVPLSAARLRDEASAAITHVPPADRAAVHWAMAALAYPFFLDAAAAAGRLLRLQDDFTLTQFKQRLAERWGARGTMPTAAQRLLHTWASWGALEILPDRGHFGPAARIGVGEAATGVAARARVLAEQSRAVRVADIRTLPDMFPFELADPRPGLKEAPDVVLHGSGSGLLASAVTDSVRLVTGP